MVWTYDFITCSRCFCMWMVLCHFNFMPIKHYIQWCFLLASIRPYLAQHAKTSIMMFFLFIVWIPMFVEFDSISLISLIAPWYIFKYSTCLVLYSINQHIFLLILPHLAYPSNNELMILPSRSAWLHGFMVDVPLFFKFQFYSSTWVREINSISFNCI